MRILSLALLALTLAACGFHLRGQSDIGVLRLTHLSIQETTPASRSLGAMDADRQQRSILQILDTHEAARQLRAGYLAMGGKLDDDAPLILRLTRETINRQTSVITPTVQAAERTVYYELAFQLRHASGVPAQAERRIRLRRGFQFDNTRIVGKFEEENLIIEDMRQQAVAQLLTQLSYVNPADLAPDAAPTPAALPAAAPQP